MHMISAVRRRHTLSDQIWKKKGTASNDMKNQIGWLKKRGIGDFDLKSLLSIVNGDTPQHVWDILEAHLLRFQQSAEASGSQQAGPSAPGFAHESLHGKAEWKGTRLQSRGIDDLIDFLQTLVRCNLSHDAQCTYTYTPSTCSHMLRKESKKLHLKVRKSIPYPSLRSSAIQRQKSQPLHWSSRSSWM